jgi:predicted phosphodiesterase
MEFDLVSDLHVDTWGRPFPVPEPGRLLVVAGDVSDDPVLTARVLWDLTRHYSRVLFVDGNHESYQDATHPERTVESMTAALRRLPPMRRKKVHYLSVDGPFIHKGVAFIGRNGWWSREGDREARIALADARSLVAEAAAMEEKPGVKEVVVVTHTPSHPGAVVLGGYIRTKEHAEMYCNRHMTELLRFPKVRLFVFGHNHTPFAKRIRGRQYLSNPRGRPGDYEGSEHYTPLTIRVK